MIIITIETDNYNGLKCNHNDGNDKKKVNYNQQKK